MQNTRKFRRKYNLSLIRKDDGYKPKDIMNLYDISRTTLNNWRKKGLKNIDNKIPIMFHGTDLYEFLAKQQSDRETKLKAGEFYCPKCKKARLPIKGSEYQTYTKANKPIIKAICNVCGTKINRFPSKTEL